MGYLDTLYRKSPLFFQTIFLNVKAIELWMERSGRKFRECLNEFNKNQWFSEAEIEEYQNEKLRILIHYIFDNVLYYRRVMKKIRLIPQDITTIHDLYKLPILTKDDIKTNYNELISPDFKWIWLRHGHTSGTTGSPLDICYSIKTCVVHQAADWRQKLWAGMQYGDLYASLQGRVIVPINQKKPPFWRMNYINNQLFLSSFHLTEKNIPFYIEKIDKSKIKYIEGYPSTLYILSLYLNKNRLTLPLKAVLTSSETLFDYQRKSIEKAFCCKIFDFYGMAERAIFASECEKHEGKHLNMDYGITEFLNSDNEPVENGKIGKIVATSLHNYAMPLIRYHTNDSCYLKNNACSCGRGFPIMDDVTTKNESIVTLPDGRLISPSVLTHSFKPMHNIIESQIIQKEIDLLVVKIVKNKNYTKKDEKQLIYGFNERLGNDVRIKVEYVNEISKTESGKFKWVISKIIPKF